MKKLIITSSLAVMTVLSGCYKNPVTGRKSLNLVDEGTLMSLSKTEYSTFLSSNRVATSGTNHDQVEKVGRRIANAVQKYLSDRGQSNLISNYQWEFNYVENNEANAWCMPGGKIVVYSGIMPYTQNEAGLATVMGHEVAHAIARHGNERMSQGLVQQLGGVALSVAVSDQPAATQNLFQTAYGVTTNVAGILPFSRKHETEADDMGLIFMAMAGYDPSEAINFWTRMSQKTGGGQVPNFLSTHPSDVNRINNIKSKLAEAQKYYKPQ